MIFKVSGTLQPYDWGGSERIATLLGLPKQTVAEWWIGAHPKSPSVLDSGQTLDVWIEENAQRALGTRVAETFGQLPFLLKILDIRRPLSIQIHPTLEQARQGYADEEKRGIPVSDPRRNFRDANHKPELAIALETTWLLFGFRELAQAHHDLKRFGLGDLVGDSADSAELLERWLTLPQGTRRERLDSLFVDAVAEDTGDPARPEFWISDWVAHHPEPDDPRRYDPGLLGFLLFNIVQLPRHAGVFLTATVPHAYLRGALVEVMANSDNVLRCGLTSKNIDVAQMMACVERAPMQPDLLRGGDASGVYQPPVQEFGIERFTGAGTQNVRSQSAELWMVLSGTVILTDAGGDPVCLAKGECAFVTAETEYEARLDGRAHCYRTFVPDADDCANR